MNSNHPAQPTPSTPSPSDEELLLYWSGELDPARAALVAQRIERDPEAKAYLAELGDLEEMFQSSLLNPSPQSPVLDTAIESARSTPTAGVGRGAWSWAIPALIFLAVCALTLSFFRPDSSTHDGGGIAAAPPDTPTQPTVVVQSDTAVPTMAQLLSRPKAPDSLAFRKERYNYTRLRHRPAQRSIDL